jgi:putative Ca2+/H+ antiporter (TMEM165/GDT1 family)
MVGRVFGAVRLFVLCGMAPGVVAFGWIADRFSAHVAMDIAAAGYLAIAVAAIAAPAIREENR